MQLSRAPDEVNRGVGEGPRTPVPNLGRKTLETVSEDGSTQLCRTFQIADIKTLNFGRGVADAGNHVVFCRKGGFVVNLDMGRRLNFRREQTWPQEPVSSTSVFSRQG